MFHQEGDYELFLFLMANLDVVENDNDNNNNNNHQAINLDLILDNLTNTIFNSGTYIINRIRDLIPTY